MSQDDFMLVREAWSLVREQTLREREQEYLGESLLSEDEQQHLVRALLLGHRQDGDEPGRAQLAEEALQLINWAREVRLEISMLDAVLRGDALIRWRDNHPQFKHPMFEEPRDGGVP